MLHRPRDRKHMLWMQPLLVSSIVFIFLFIPSTLPAYQDERGPSLEQLGAAVSPIADAVSPGSRVFNPAAGSEITHWAVSASFARSFNLPEFDRFQLTASVPLGSWTAGIWGAGFGRELYTERSAGVNLSHPIYQRLHAGIGVSGTQVHVKNYGNDAGFSADIGLFWNHQWISVGATARDIFSSDLRNFANSRPARKMQLAIQANLNPSLRIFAETAFEEWYDPGYRFGTEVWLFDPLAVRAGYDSSARRIHLGIAIQWSGLTAQGAYDHHPWLGWSHAFGMQWYPGANGR